MTSQVSVLRAGAPRRRSSALPLLLVLALAIPVAGLTPGSATPAHAAAAKKKPAKKKPAKKKPPKAVTTPKPAEDPALAEAKALFGEAQGLYDLGRFDEALEVYSRAYEVKPLPAFLFNIAQCHRNLENWERAVFFFRRFLEAKPDTPNRAEVEALVVKLEAKLAEIEEAERAEAERKRLEALSAAAAFSTATPGEPGVKKKKSVAKRWWFWTIIGVAVVGGGAATGAYFLFFAEPGPDGIIDHR
jgi:tetratricopeptide (TPR) repeat protein